MGLTSSLVAAAFKFFIYEGLRLEKLRAYQRSCDVHTDLTEWKMRTMGDVCVTLYKVQDTFSKPLLVFLIGE